MIEIPSSDQLPSIFEEVRKMKANPYKDELLGRRKTLVLLFFNSSLRTRLSTQKAAQHLGMNVMVMNFDKEAWKIEFEDGTKMNAQNSEHIKEAARVISQFCDVIAVRAFPTLTDKKKDESEWVLSNFRKYALVPVINMESATAHPLQALADAITIDEHKKNSCPKVVLSWAPHPKALPHAVANSFIQMMQQMQVDFIITHPKGYELNSDIVGDNKVTYHQEEAFENADFIYAKNWSSYTHYGQILYQDKNWMITEQKMKFTNKAQFMHCLPVRRNVVVEDVVLDSPNSLVIKQAENRIYSAQIVLRDLLLNM